MPFKVFCWIFQFEKRGGLGAPSFFKLKWKKKQKTSTEIWFLVLIYSPADPYEKNISEHILTKFNH